MKTVIINESQKKTLQMVNENVTVFSFIHHVKDYFKKLLKDPVYAKPDEFLVANGLNGEKLKRELEDMNILKKREKIETIDGRDKFNISYSISSENIERKLRRLYSKLFETNIVEGTVLEECDCGMGGAGNAAACNDSAPITSLGTPQRRKTIYITQKQAERLKEEVEMGTAFGDFGYDAPPFKKKKDPSYDHKNMMKKSFNHE